ncbi:hypothetical protein EJG51_018410 [Undibacterium piscinae]|uniref:Efflux RND transporter periplasmic adaptor subunit n=1 Tax=Undibacterium piscinae TaxID=2495591 RepID=A0A6M4A8F6_9BURK|nr:hypothetical protein EJG51_018410 [Undibacterium piscinae]
MRQVRAQVNVPDSIWDLPRQDGFYGYHCGQRLAPRPVELDGWSNGEWIVTKGLQNGDRVLVDGVIKAHTVFCPGMTVTPVALAAKDAATQSATPAKPAAASTPAAH